MKAEKLQNLEIDGTRRNEDHLGVESANIFRGGGGEI